MITSVNLRSGNWEAWRQHKTKSMRFEKIRDKRLGLLGMKKCEPFGVYEVCIATANEYVAGKNS
eukprot:1182793-Prorocentrum_minimum.AAC.3